MHLAKAVARHMRIDLGRADAGVAQQLLDNAQVGAVLQQMRREAVPQHMRRDVAGDAGAAYALFDAQPEGYRRKWRPAAGQKDTGGGPGGDKLGPARTKVAFQGRNRLAPTGTTRSLLPLPMTLMKPASRWSCSSLTPRSSAKRRPEA